MVNAPIQTFGLSPNEVDYLPLPDGNVYRSDAGGQGGGPEFGDLQKGTATPAQVDAYIKLNYLLRPPLTDCEIQLMPVADVIVLYYTLCPIVACFQNKPNPVTARGLPYIYGVVHDNKIQQRIYSLRPELHQVADASGKIYRVLLPPSSMLAPKCDESATTLQFATLVLSIVTLGAAWWVTAIVTAAEAVGQAANNAVLMADINKAQGVAREVLIGVNLAKLSIRDPAPDGQLIKTCQQSYVNWQQACDQASATAQATLSLWRIMPAPYAMIAYMYDPQFDQSWIKRLANQGRNDINDPVGPRQKAQNDAVIADNASRYVSDWTPYRQFFWSGAVAQMVLAAATTSSSTAVAVTAPATPALSNVIIQPGSQIYKAATQNAPTPPAQVAAGIGLLWLLFLL